MQAVTRQRRTDTSVLVNVAPDVVGLQLSMANLYFVGESGAGDRSWALIDAGLAFSVGTIASAAKQRFGSESRPAAIILTHGHFDHVGAVEKLAKYWDAPVYAHELEMPYLTGKSDYPPPDPTVGGGLITCMSRFFPRSGINLGSRVHVLPSGGSVPGMPGWRWIHTPGHTAGHVSLFRDADRVLIAGDAFVTVRQESALAVLSQRREIRRPPAYYTTDWPSARRSVRELAMLQPSVAATGHGLPMYGERLRQELDALAQDFDRAAIPAHGRYVREPAITDQRGVVYVPRPAPDPTLAVLAAVGIAAVLGTAAARRYR